MDNNLRLAALATAIAAFSTGCATVGPLTPRSHVSYDLGLSQVERPANAKQQYGDTKITRADSAGVRRYLFEDQMVRIMWVPAATEFDFLLLNKTEHSIKIVWDEAAFVDEAGKSHRVIHQGVKYVDRNQSQPPGVVAHGTTLSDFVAPTDRIHYVGSFIGWLSQPLLFSADTTGKDKVGKTLRVLLPLQIEGVVNEYTFSFEVLNATRVSPPSEREVTR